MREPEKVGEERPVRLGVAAEQDDVATVDHAFSVRMFDRRLSTEPGERLSRRTPRSPSAALEAVDRHVVAASAGAAWPNHRVIRDLPNSSLSAASSSDGGLNGPPCTPCSVMNVTSTRATRPPPNSM